MSQQQPAVTVIIGAYNAMPYVTSCVRSVFEQSLDPGQIEIIAVDDGSTDGTGRELDRLATEFPGMRVVHQANSGGPAGPRNHGVELAQGRYVFFLDADDRLGPEALERVVGMADREGSDVVLGKMVGVGRGTAKSMFTRDQPRAGLFSSRVYWSLSAQKLFRRAFLNAHGLRFSTEWRVGEDMHFTAQAYLRAGNISVVSDYACYYLTRRGDGQNITSTDRDLAARLSCMETIMAEVAAHVPPGSRRDTLMRRHFESDINRWLTGLLVRLDPAAQATALTQVRGLLENHYTAELRAKVPVVQRVRFELILRSRFDEALELCRYERAGTSPGTRISGDRAYAELPYFRDPTVGLPDEVYEITGEITVRHRLDEVLRDGSVVTLRGHGFLDRVDTLDVRTAVVLRERDSLIEYEQPVQPIPRPRLTEEFGEQVFNYAAGGFEAVCDLATAADGRPLPEGLWDVWLSVRTRGLRKDVRIGAKHADTLVTAPDARFVTAPDGWSAVVTTYYTNPYGNLTFDIGGLKNPVAQGSSFSPVSWETAGRPALRVRGTVAVRDLAPSALRLAVTRPDGRVTELPLDCTPREDGCAVSAALPLDRIFDGCSPLGRWHIHLDLVTARARTTLPLPGGNTLAPLYDWPELAGGYLSSATADDALVLTVVPSPRGTAD